MLFKKFLSVRYLLNNIWVNYMMVLTCFKTFPEENLKGTCMCRKRQKQMARCWLLAFFSYTLFLKSITKENNLLTWWLAYIVAAKKTRFLWIYTLFVYLMGLSSFLQLRQNLSTTALRRGIHFKYLKYMKKRQNSSCFFLVQGKWLH